MVERQHFSVGAEKTRMSGGGMSGRGAARRVSPHDQYPQHAIDMDGYTLCRSERWPASTTFPDLDWEQSAPKARCAVCAALYESLSRPTG